MYTKGKWKAEGLDEILIMGNDTTCVARIVKTYHPECQDANARLIAAAPLLYEALKLAKGMLEALHIQPDDPIYLQIKQAIAKVEG